MTNRNEVTINNSKTLKVRSTANFLLENNIYLVFIIMVIICCVLTSNFYSYENITNLMKQNTIIGILAFGQLLIIMTGDIDLSVGSICGAANVAVAVTLRGEMSLALSLLLAIALGVGMGALNGFFSVFRALPPFIVTLAMMTIGRGLAYIWSGGRPINVIAPELTTINKTLVIGIPQLATFLIIVFVIMVIILRFTSYGRIIKAIGSNAEAVRLAGLRVNLYRFSVYVITGFLCSLGGILGTVRTGVGSPLFGEGYELDAIAMVVIGGASLSGGKGDAVKTIVGIFTIGMISNIMNLTNVSPYLQQIIKGVIILAAIYAHAISNNKNRL
jgi:ribose transport system permease protein